MPTVPRRRFSIEALVPVLLPAGIWLLLMVANAAQPIYDGTLEWDAALLHSWVSLFRPAVLSFVVSGLCIAFPLERGTLRWRVPLHLVAFVVLVAAMGWLDRISAERIRAGGRPDNAALQLRRRGEAAGSETRMPVPPHFIPPPPPEERIEGARPLSHRAGPMRMRHLLVQFANSRWQLHMLVYLATFGVVHAVKFHFRAEERQRKALELAASLSQAKLEALRLQLQPHFLFNTLNAISTLVHRDANAADEMITSLSEMLRLSLDTKEQEVPLRRELELLDRYLAIEQVRLGARLRVERAIDPVALEVLVPALMLQTIVENAVRHGIEPQTEAGTITLSAERAGDLLRLAVTDTGVGLGALDVRSERRGIGLANTEARLRELHRDAAHLNLHEPPEGGVCVEIELPWRTGAPAQMPAPEERDRS